MEDVQSEEVLGDVQWSFLATQKECEVLTTCENKEMFQDLVL